MPDEPPKFTVVPPSEIPEGDVLPQSRKQSDKVVPLPVITSLDIDPKRILQAALDADLDSVVVIGYTKNIIDENNRNASDEYFASSIAAGDTVLWLLQRYCMKLLRYADEPDDGSA